MWNFGISLALVCLWPTLRLAAVSGLIHGGAVLLSGAAVGHWIDNVPRRRAAATTLTVNNACIVVSSTLLAIAVYWEHQDLLVLLTAVAASTVAYVASMGSKVIVSRDWLVVLCQGDKEALAHANAVLLRVNLTAMVLSPLITGLVMRWLGVGAGCLLIACWNVVSYIAELVLLLKLARDVGERSSDERDVRTTGNAMDAASTYKGDTEGDAGRTQMTESSQRSQLTPEHQILVLDSDRNDENLGEKHPKPVATVQNVFEKCFGGWRTFYAQNAFPAGLALALLYFTVLGLCSLTTGYAYKQGITEDVLAAVRGVSALVGIGGSLAFPKLRAKLGCPKTGVVSLICQLSVVSLSVISIWLPGSPFDLSVNAHGINDTTITNTTHDCVGVSDVVAYDQSQVSVWTFLVGVVLARFGLWGADLSITQIFQETVPESSRGIVGGVQQSLNQTLELLMNGIVIILPYMHTFGLLIITSFSAIVVALFAMVYYTVKVTK